MASWRDHCDILGPQGPMSQEQSAQMQAMQRGADVYRYSDKGVQPPVRPWEAGMRDAYDQVVRSLNELRGEQGRLGEAIGILEQGMFGTVGVMPGAECETEGGLKLPADTGMCGRLIGELLTLSSVVDTLMRNERAYAVRIEQLAGRLLQS